MKYRVLIQPGAVAELKQAHSWIRGEAPTRAAAWLDDLLESIQTLERMSRRCPVAPESRSFDREIRQLISGSYRLLFTIENDAVVVLHIRHGARRVLDPNAETELNE